jgi:hypothetical protein
MTINAGMTGHERGANAK